MYIQCIYIHIIYVYMNMFVCVYIYIYMVLVSVWSVKNFDESAFYGNRTRFFSKTDRFQKAAIFSS